MKVSFYNEIKEILISARNKVYQTANFAMVEAQLLKNKVEMRKRSMVQAC